MRCARPARAGRAAVLHGEGTKIDGMSFFGLGAGVPVTPWDWSFDLSEEEAAERLAGCPEGGVLVVHSPPKGHLDKGFGSEAILQTIETKHPRAAVFGHIHECQGRREQLGPTLLANLGLPACSSRSDPRRTLVRVTQPQEVPRRRRRHRRGAGAAAHGGAKRARKQRSVDVAIVGGGLAGLTAARALARAGKEVCVLEARDRVGGRTLNHDIGGGKIAEAGGEFIGPTQDRILALAKSVGVRSFKVYNDGLDVQYLRGQRSTYPASGLPSDPAVQRP